MGTLGGVGWLAITLPFKVFFSDSGEVFPKTRVLVSKQTSICIPPPRTFNGQKHPPKKRHHKLLFADSSSCSWWFHQQEEAEAHEHEEKKATEAHFGSRVELYQGFCSSWQVRSELLMTAFLPPGLDPEEFLAGIEEDRGVLFSTPRPPFPSRAHKKMLGAKGSDV